MCVSQVVDSVETMSFFYNHTSYSFILREERRLDRYYSDKDEFYDPEVTAKAILLLLLLLLLLPAVAVSLESEGPVTEGLRPPGLNSLGVLEKQKTVWTLASPCQKADRGMLDNCIMGP